MVTLNILLIFIYSYQLIVEVIMGLGIENKLGGQCLVFLSHLALFNIFQNIGSAQK